MSRVGLFILALGMVTTGAFHAPRRVTAGSSRPTELKNTNDFDIQPRPSGFQNSMDPPNVLENFKTPENLDWNPKEAAFDAGMQVVQKPTKQKKSAAYAPTSSSDASSSAIQPVGTLAPTDSAAVSKILSGGSIGTWSYRSALVEHVQVILSTEGRPLNAEIELWNGPDNTPVTMRVFVENGQLRPFSAVIETPRAPNTVAIRNVGDLEFPLAADVYANDIDEPSVECISSAITIQGGAIRTELFYPQVDSVQVYLSTKGNPLNARIELLQGPNNNKQVMELYADDGLDRPFFCILETPGSGNVVRVVNTGPVEFPMYASVVPNSITEAMPSGLVMGGDVAPLTLEETGGGWWQNLRRSFTS